MTEHKGQTNEVTQVTLPSAVEQVLWTAPSAPAGGLAGVEVHTHFVGNGAALEIRVVDHRGRTVTTTKGRVVANLHRSEVAIPADAEGGLTAKVSLPDHALSKDSGMLLIRPGVTVTNAKWSAAEARSGDVLTLSADVKNAVDGTEALVTILEHDADGAHDLVTRFPALVEGGKVEAEWEFEYHEDTDDIPTDEEVEKGYNPPKYFFWVSVEGNGAESGILHFKDWFEIVLEASPGVPFADQKYETTFADGSTRTGTLDATGRARLADVPPGPVEVRFPDLEGEEG